MSDNSSDRTIEHIVSYYEEQIIILLQLLMQEQQECERLRGLLQEWVHVDKVAETGGT